MMSRSRIGARNCIVSIATVAQGPCTSRPATMPPAISICASTQPPKIWPFELMSAGGGTTRRTGSRPAVSDPVGSDMKKTPSRRVGIERVVYRFVKAGAAGQEDQPHQRRREQHGKADAERGGNIEKER